MSTSAHRRLTSWHLGEERAKLPVIMAKRLSTKHKKRRHDQATAYKAGAAPRKHKVAEERSTRAKKKKAYVMN